jgi:hypothetical protein
MNALKICILCSVLFFVTVAVAEASVRTYGANLNAGKIIYLYPTPKTEILDTSSHICSFDGHYHVNIHKADNVKVDYHSIADSQKKNIVISWYTGDKIKVTCTKYTVEIKAYADTEVIISNTFPKYK